MHEATETEPLIVNNKKIDRREEINAEQPNDFTFHVQMSERYWLDLEEMWCDFDVSMFQELKRAQDKFSCEPRNAISISRSSKCN